MVGLRNKAVHQGGRLSQAEAATARATASEFIGHLENTVATMRQSQHGAPEAGTRSGESA